MKDLWNGIKELYLLELTYGKYTITFMQMFIFFFVMSLVVGIIKEIFN